MSYNTPHDSQAVEFDPRVDQYLRGKMSEEEEIAFEIEYLDNPELLAQVEMVNQLITGLKQCQPEISFAADQMAHAQTALTRASQAEPSETASGKIKRLLTEWFTPQTAWGAVAATVLLVPLMSTINQPASPLVSSPMVQGTYVHLLGQKVRSTTQTLDTIYIEPDQSNLVIGFASQPSFGVPDPLSVTVYNAQNQIVWQQQGLQPDYRWTVYVSISGSSITAGQYRYELTDGSNIVSGGEFALAYN